MTVATFDVVEFALGHVLAAGWLADVADDDADLWRAYLDAVGIDRRDGKAEAEEVLRFVDDDGLGRLVHDAYEFVRFHESDLLAAQVSGLSERQLGCDMWLSRCGHGTGFWDHGLGDVGIRLHRAAGLYSEVSVDVRRGADGWEVTVM